MADDLEEFLRKAAERRAARQRAKSSAPEPKKPLASERIEAPIILEPLDEVPSISSQRDLGRLKPHVPPPQHLAQNIDQADERMDAHLRQAFDHPVSRLEQKSKKKKKQAESPKRVTNAAAATPTIASSDLSGQSTAYDYEATRSIPQANRSMIGSTSDLVTILRNPQSLKLAFIASEIFKRKFE